MSPPRPLDEYDAVIWVGQPPGPAPAAGRQARFIGDLSVDSDRRAALEMAEELFGGPVEVVTTGSP